jgi:DNA-binding beta-propeller fold protein YncE
MKADPTSHSRAFEYDPVPEWEAVPAHLVHADVSDVATDSEDHVYLLTRSDARVIVYDRNGRFLRSWGEDTLSPRPHGITITPDDAVWIVDEGDQTVAKHTQTGELLLRLGTSGLKSETGADWTVKDFVTRQSLIKGGPPFNHPTSLALSEEGDIYVADGYGNARVHHFDAVGNLVGSYGEGGSGCPAVQTAALRLFRPRGTAARRRSRERANPTPDP